jgi:hypothetical protein
MIWRCSGGAPPTRQSVIENAERQSLTRAADVRSVAPLAPGDQTVLLNVSYGTTSGTIAENLLDLMESAPKGSAADKRVAELGDDAS